MCMPGWAAAGRGRREALLQLTAAAVLWVHCWGLPGQPPSRAVLEPSEDAPPSPEKEFLLALSWADQLGWSSELPLCGPDNMMNVSEVYKESCIYPLTEINVWPNVICSPEKHVLGLCLGQKGLGGSMPEDWSTLSELKLLVLSDNNCSGTLPSSWGNLTQLVYINLSNNSLTGSLPPSWSRMASLKEVELSYNNLNGSLPSTWGDLTQLTVIRLPVNKNLSGSLPVTWGGMKALQLLDLSDNNCIGTLPSSWGNLTQLVYIKLGINRLNGSLPPSWSGMMSLFELDLSYNNLNGSLPSTWGDLTQLTVILLGKNKNLCGSLPVTWGGMKALQVLDLSDNNCIGTLPSSWGNLTQLFGIYLRNNSLNGSLPPSWSRMASLTELDLSYNNINGSLPSTWGDLTQLTVIELNENSNLSGSLPASWGGMKALQVLDLTGIHGLTGTLPAEWETLTQLNTLYLTGKKLKGMLPPSWSGMRSMQKLFLDGNELSGTLPSEWGSMPNLTELWLGDNKVTGPLPAAWAGMHSLSSLHLVRNSLSGTLPPVWGNLANLGYMGMNRMNLTGPLPSEWRKLTQLSELLLGGNKLSGPLPPEWSDMTKLEMMDLSNNALSGSLPGQWGNLSYLSDLGLSGNKLSGSLPSEWGNLTQMVALRLSNNQLSGSLPLGWSNLTDLLFLDLSYNSLSGPLPSQWGNLTKGWLSLQGNRLTGTLPDNISISPASVLLLSNNVLSGTLPQAWKAPLLRVLSVGNNPGLKPPVPDGWWDKTSFPTISLLDVGTLMTDTASDKDWKKRVCLNQAVFSQDNLSNLTRSVTDEILPALQASGIVDIDAYAFLVDLNVGGMLERIPNDTLHSIHDLCKNEDVSKLLWALWGSLLAVIVGGSLLRRLVAPHWDSIVTGGSDVRLMAELSAALMASLYWYDWATDVIVINEVWPQIWAKLLLAFAVLNYGVSACIMTAYVLHVKRPPPPQRQLSMALAGYVSSLVPPKHVLRIPVLWVLLVAVMPILDTLALVQFLLRDWGVTVLEVKLDVEPYLHMRDVVKAVFTSLPTAVITSVTYALGARPTQGIVYSKDNFIASLCGSMMLMAWAWFGALYYAEKPDPGGTRPPGLRRHLRRVFLGETLYDAPSTEDAGLGLNDTVEQATHGGSILRHAGNRSLTLQGGRDEEPPVQGQPVSGEPGPEAAEQDPLGSPRGASGGNAGASNTEPEYPVLKGASGRSEESNTADSRGMAAAQAGRETRHKSLVLQMARTWPRGTVELPRQEIGLKDGSHGQKAPQEARLHGEGGGLPHVAGDGNALVPHPAPVG
eukprot:jgi/Botrbrau1/7847/Bobra.9_2s0024.1